MEQTQLSKESIKGIQADMAPREQIQQHEWERKYKWFHKCPHCECVMIVPSLGTNAYIPKAHPHNSKSLSEEPTCITRKKSEHGADTAT